MWCWAGLGWAGPREAGLALVGAGGGHTALALQPHTHRGLHAVVCGVMCGVRCEMCVVVCATLHTTQGVRCRGCTGHQARLGAGCGPGRGQPGSSDSPGADAGAATL